MVLAREGRRVSGAVSGRDAGEDPRASLLVHEAAGAVDGIDDDAPPRARRIGASGQDEAPTGQAFSDEDDGITAGHIIFECRNEPLLADAVDCVDGVPFVVVGHFRHLFGGGGLTRGDDLVPDDPVQATQWGEKVLDSPRQAQVRALPYPSGWALIQAQALATISRASVIFACQPSSRRIFSGFA